MKTFFVGSPSFHDYAISTSQKRPIQDLDEMWECMKKKWNNKVGYTDTVYIFESFATCELEKKKFMLKLLNGNHFYITAQSLYPHHPSTYMNYIGIASHVQFKWENHVLELINLVDVNYKFFEDTNIYQFFSHPGSWEKSNNQCINISCHLWDYEPISLEEIIECTRKKNSPYH